MEARNTPQEKAPGALAGAARGGSESWNRADDKDRESATQGGSGAFARLARAAVFDEKLSAEAVRVLAALAVYANREGQCYPAIGTLAGRLRCTSRQVQRHLRSLRELGYVVVFNQTRRAGGGKAPNVYVLRYPPLRSSASEGLSSDDGSEGGEVADETEDGSEGPSRPNAINTTSDVALPAADVPRLFDEPAQPIGNATSNVAFNATSDDASDATSDVATNATSDVTLTSPYELAHRNKPSATKTRAQARTSGGAGLRTFDDDQPRDPSQAVERALRSAIGDVETRWLVIFDAMDLGNGRFDAWGQEALRGTLDVRAMLRELAEAKRLAS